MADEGKDSARMDDDAMAGAIAVPGESLDDEFESLFSAFDDVSASDALVASTISAVAGSGSGSTADTGGRSGSSDRDASSFVAVKGGKGAEDRRSGTRGKSEASGDSGKRRRARFRAFRVAAVAACLALALTGGVAYAVPTSHVTVSSEGVSVDIGVNLFGMAVSATSDSEDGRSVIGSADLLNKPYEEALAHAVDTMGSLDDDRGFEVVVESGDEGQRRRLEDGSAALMAERGYGQRADEGMVFQPEAGGEPGEGPGNPPDAQAQPDSAEQAGGQPQPEGQQSSPPEGGQEAGAAQQPVQPGGDQTPAGRGAPGPR